MAEWNRKETMENARTGYQGAIDLHTNEVDSLWAKFNSLLVANSIILASIGLSMTASDMTANLTVFLNVMPVVGIALCWLWLSVIRRGFAYHRYWILSARHLEELYLSRPVRTLSRGAKFAGGSEVRLPIGNKIEPVQVGPLGRLKAEKASYVVICLFLLIYLIVLASNVINAATGAHGEPRPVNALKTQIQQRDKQIYVLEKRILEKEKAIEDARRRSDAVILKLVQQIEKQQESLRSQKNSEED